MDIFALVDLIAVCFETFLAYYFAQKLFLRRTLPTWLWLGAFALFGAGLMGFSLLPVPPIVRILYTFFGFFLLCRSCFFSSLLHAVYVGVIFCAIFVFTDILCYWLLLFFGWDPNQIMTASVQRVIYIVLAKIVQLFLMVMATMFMRRENFLLKLRSIVPLLLCQVFSIYLCDNMMRISAQSGMELLSGRFILIVLGILYLNIILVVYAEVIKARQAERHTAELREQQLTLQLSYYKSMQSEQERTRALYHDMQKHLSAMEALVDRQNKSSADQLLQELKTSVQEVGDLVDVGNLEVSAILNHYVQLSREAEIPVSLSVWVPPKLAISPLELNTIIGNSFENAIEACLALPIAQRKISVQIKLHNQSLLLYEISNSHGSNEKVRLHRNGGDHGYGIQNIKKIVNQYHGNLRITQTEQEFTLSAYLNLPVTAPEKR